LSYYQLNTIDFDGSSKLSSIVPVHFTGSEKPFTVIAQENSWEVNYNGYSKEDMIVIYNAVGQIVYQTKLTQEKKASLKIDTSYFADGIYIIAGKIGNSRHSEKLIIR
jgi:hypothetical protein